MEQTLLNDIISTSIGGAAGGAVAGIVVGDTGCEVRLAGSSPR